MFSDVCLSPQPVLIVNGAARTGLFHRLSGGVAVPAVAAVLMGTTASLCPISQAMAQTAPNPVDHPPIHAVQRGRAPHHVSLRRETHPPRAPESSQGQVTNANATAPNAGVFPFIPPYFTKIGDAGLSVDTKGIGFATNDKAMQFRIGGRYQEDFSAASVSPRLPRSATPLLANDGIDSRRAFFEAYLTLNTGIAAVFQYDFANATQPIQDAAVAYQAPHTNVIYTIGNFKEPFSLNQLVSDNVTTFTERAQMDGIVPGRNFGGAIATFGDKWTATGGVFGGNANNTLTDNGIAGTARVTYAPILEKTQLLHFGVAGSYRSLDSNGVIPSFNSRPEDGLERALINTGALRNADAIERVNGEAIYQFGSYRIVGEYTYANVTGRNGQADRSFQGGYVEGAWVVNGNGRPYRVAAPYGSEMAVLQGVQVEDGQRVSRGGFGVFEVAARYSALDLRAPGVQGGYQQDVTAGLNWYPDRNLRFMADYVHAFLDPAAAAISNRSYDSDAFVGRMQVNW